MVGWQLVLNYMQASLTQYYLESDGRVAYIETHPKKPRKLEWTNKPLWILGFCKAQPGRTKGEGEWEEKGVVYSTS